MTLTARPLLMAVTLVLSACNYSDGTANKPGTSALIGGVPGAALGKAVGGDDRSAIIGGVPASRISYSGRGFAEPTAANNSAAGRAMNRRVEVVNTWMI